MPLRSSRISVKDVEGIIHSVDVHADSLFEAAAAAIFTFRQETWAVQALTPTSILRVEVQLPPIVHEVVRHMDFQEALIKYVYVASLSDARDLISTDQREVAFAKDTVMVQLVARDVEGQPPHRAIMSVHAPAPGPRR